MTVFSNDEVSFGCLTHLCEWMSCLTVWSLPVLTHLCGVDDGHDHVEELSAAQRLIGELRGETRAKWGGDKNDTLSHRERKTDCVTD